jgi:hypothetical protein
MIEGFLESKGFAIVEKDKGSFIFAKGRHKYLFVYSRATRQSHIYGCYLLNAGDKAGKAFLKAVKIADKNAGRVADFLERYHNGLPK